MSTLWHNGTFIEDGPVFSANDRVRLGDGVFDTMGAVDGVLQHVERHFERLHRHAAILKITIPYSVSDLIDVAQKSLTQLEKKTGHALIRTIVTRGPSFRGIAVPDAPEIQVVMCTSGLPAPENMPPPSLVIARSTQRNECSPLSQIKSLHYADNILAKMEAEERGANDAVMLSTAGALACTTTGNLFVLKGGKLLTPPLSDGVIDGVVRGLLLEGGHAQEQSLTEDDLRGAEGLYLSNSIRGVVPVVSFDGADIPAPSLDIPHHFYID